VKSNKLLEKVIKLVHPRLPTAIATPSHANKYVNVSMSTSLLETFLLTMCRKRGEQSLGDVVQKKNSVKEKQPKQIVKLSHCVFCNFQTFWFTSKC